MRLSDEELLTVNDLAHRLEKSEEYIRIKLRTRQFQRVIVEKHDSGGTWQAHYYFDNSGWPHAQDKKVVQLSGGRVFHYLLDRDGEGDQWLEDAVGIFIPLTAVEAWEEAQVNIPAVRDQGRIKSTRLRAAFCAYQEFYVLNKLEKGKGGHAKQIQDWLKKRYSTLTSGERKSIAAVVNLDPRRGHQ